jgi:hypothetical protein
MEALEKYLRIRHGLRGTAPLTATIYQDSYSLGAARTLYDLITNSLDGQVTGLFSVWSFQALEDSLTAQAAAASAASAQVILLAANRCDRIPADVFLWLDALSDRDVVGERCLVGVFPGNWRDRHRPGAQRLSEWTDQRGWHLFLPIRPPHLAA